MSDKRVTTYFTCDKIICELFLNLAHKKEKKMFKSKK